MTEQGEKDAQALVPRAERFASHALVDVRTFRYLPFGAESALLLDISETGFKAEFTGESIAKPGKTYWLDIPLSPLGIKAPSRLMCRAECRWFDDKRYRFGGVFVNLSSVEKSVINQVVEALRSRGHALL